MQHLEKKSVHQIKCTFIINIELFLYGELKRDLSLVLIQLIGDKFNVEH